MKNATRIPTAMANWPPVTRHYQVDGGYLAVNVLDFLGATGTRIFYCDELGGSMSMTPIAEFAAGTSFGEALEQMGYTVIDEVGDEISSEEIYIQEQQEASVIEMLPPEISEMVQNALGN